MTKEERRDGLQHECELPPEETEFASAKAYTSGYCIGFKRLVMYCFIIWHNNSQSMKIYKSDHVIRQNNIRHLQSGNLVMHPFSIFRYSWEIFMIITLSVIYLLPLHSSIDYTIKYYLNIVLVSINFLDILITFNSGYLIKQLSFVAMDRNMIIKNYLKTWFFPDLVAILCYAEFLVQYIPITMLRNYANFFILIRLHVFFRNIKNIEAFYISYSMRIRILQLILALIITLIWTLNIYYVALSDVLDELRLDWEERLEYQMRIFYRFWSNICMMGWSNINFEKELLIADTVTLLLGFCLKILFISLILSTYAKYKYIQYKFLDVVQQMYQFATIKHLPDSIRHRMNKHMQYIYKQKKFREDMILSSMSSSLRQEVLSFIYSQLVEKSSTFQIVPMDIILKLTNRLKTAIFMPSDVIIQAGTSAECMYFIKSGMVAIYAESGKEMCHLKDGGSFGELAVLESEIRTSSVVAIDWCEVCILSRNDILEVFEKDSELLHKIKQGVYKRAALIHIWNDLEESVASETIYSDDSNSTVLHM